MSDLPEDPGPPEDPELTAQMKRVRLIIMDVDGVLTDGGLHIDGEGRPFRTFSSRDGLGLTMWRIMGGQNAIVTGLDSKAVRVIAARWKCVALATKAGDKAMVCRGIAQKQDIPLEEVAFIGDDILDLPALRIVGLAVAVSDAHPTVQAAAHFVTETPGGKGAVRELVERLIAARGDLDAAIERYQESKTAGAEPKEDG